MYASQTKRLCVRGAQSDETRVQHHSSSEATTGSSLSNHTQQSTQQSRTSAAVAGNNMTASATNIINDATESPVTSTNRSTSASFPNQTSNDCNSNTQSILNVSEESTEHELINKLAKETKEEAQVDLLITIRNLITACNRKKDSIVNNPNFCKIISLIDREEPSSSVKTQLALLICSVAKSSEHNVKVLNRSSVDEKIFNLILNSRDEALIEAGLRCLRSIMSWPRVSRTWLLYETQTTDSNNPAKVSKDIALNKDSLQKIVDCARGSKSHIVQECVADIFAATCARPKDQVLLYKASAIPCIAQLLESSSQRVVISALSWLMHMCLRNNLISLEVTRTSCPSGMSVLDRLTLTMNKDNCCELQFLSARCFANIYRALVTDNLKDDQRIVSHVLPTLIRMIHQDKPPQIRAKAAECLAYLVECEVRLQNIASVCDHLIESLANMLEFEHSFTDLQFRYDQKNNEDKFLRLFEGGGAWLSVLAHSPPSYQAQQNIDSTMNHPTKSDRSLENISGLNQELRRAAFLALASLASNLEPIRKKIFDTCSIMQHLVKSLTDSDTKTLKSVLTCLLSLSRSVAQLRTSFAENSVYSALKNLLTTASNDVLILVLAILCNVSLDFSPGKQHFLDDNTLEILCKLTRGSDSFLRLHGMWILMNMVYQLRDESLKFRILRSLGVNHVLGLLETGDDDEIVLKTLGFLRNLLSQDKHINAIMSSHGEQIMQSLVRILERPTSARIKEQTLCVLTNIADGSESKTFIMSNQVVLAYLARVICDDHAGDLRLAAICCITNLAHKENEGSYERCDAMKKLGIEDKLKSMLNTSDPILSDRVRTAYNQFSIDL